jgi:Bifunctional DNA primase/polymerase, N-terminal
MSMSMLAAALTYARKGIPVFPCDPRDKTPLCPRGFHAANTNETWIRLWWRQEPNAMRGAPCGPPSGLWVLDVDIDPERSIDGGATLAELVARHGPLPLTLTSLTPRGGVQHFFRWNGAHIRNSSGKIGGGIDVRGDGGYVVLPPSMRADGTPYRWQNPSLSPVDAPAWLIEEAIKAPSSSAGGTPRLANSRRAMREAVLPVNGSPAPSSPRAHAWALAALRIACERIAAAKEGTRNHTLNAEAFDLFRLVAGGHLDEERARASLLQAADKCGLVEDDGEVSVLNTIKSAARAGLASPRQYPGR